MIRRCVNGSCTHIEKLHTPKCTWLYANGKCCICKSFTTSIEPKKKRWKGQPVGICGSSENRKSLYHRFSRSLAYGHCVQNFILCRSFFHQNIIDPQASVIPNYQGNQPNRCRIMSHPQSTKLTVIADTFITSPTVCVDPMLSVYALWDRITGCCCWYGEYGYVGGID